jgi:hypothetical protein
MLIFVQGDEVRQRLEISGKGGWRYLERLSTDQRQISCGRTKRYSTRSPDHQIGVQSTRIIAANPKSRWGVVRCVMSSRPRSSYRRAYFNFVDESRITAVLVHAEPSKDCKLQQRTRTDRQSEPVLDWPGMIVLPLLNFRIPYSPSYH